MFRPGALGKLSRVVITSSIPPTECGEARPLVISPGLFKPRQVHIPLPACHMVSSHRKLDWEERAERAIEQSKQLTAVSGKKFSHALVATISKSIPMQKGRELVEPSEP